MRLGFRRRISVRFNEVLSDTYTRHFIVKLVHTKGKWRNVFVEDTRATQGPLQRKGQGTNLSKGLYRYDFAVVAFIHVFCDNE